MAKTAREKIKLESTAGTGHFYTATKSKQTTPEKMEMMKFEPKARKHVAYKEVTLKQLGPLPRRTRPAVARRVFCRREVGVARQARRLGFVRDDVRRRLCAAPSGPAGRVAVAASHRAKKSASQGGAFSWEKTLRTVRLQACAARSL